MEIEFANRRLERCYHEPKQAQRAWGPSVAEVYAERINIIRRFRRFEDLYRMRKLRLHPLRGQLAGLYAIDLWGRWRLIVRPISPERVIIEGVSNHYGD